MVKKNNVEVSGFKRRDKSIIRKKQGLLTLRERSKKNTLEKKAGEKCHFCRRDMSKDNAKYILQQLTMVGYVSYDFCSNKCLLNYIFKKFRELIRRMAR